MNDIPGLNYIPERWRGWVLLFIALSPYLTRAYHALATGGGLRGVLSAIWLGTNSPRQAEDKAASDAAKLPVLAFFIGLASLTLAVSGCSAIKAGNDPFVVRVEQSQKIGFTTVDTFLKIDDANRGFFRTNAAPAHAFAESLRQWRVDRIPPDGHLETNRVWVSYFKSLDRIKLAYKAHTASSNDVVQVLATVETTVAEAQRYLMQGANANVPSNP